MAVRQHHQRVIGSRGTSVRSGRSNRARAALITLKVAVRRLAWSSLRELPGCDKSRLFPSRTFSRTCGNSLLVCKPTPVPSATDWHSHYTTPTVVGTILISPPVLHADAPPSPWCGDRAAGLDRLVDRVGTAALATHRSRSGSHAFAADEIADPHPALPFALSTAATDSGYASRRRHWQCYNIWRVGRSMKPTTSSLARSRPGSQANLR